MPDVVIGRNCKIKKAIIDTGTILEEGTEIGINPVADKERGFRVTESGITLVTPSNFGQMLHRVR